MKRSSIFLVSVLLVLAATLPTHASDKALSTFDSNSNYLSPELSTNNSFTGIIIDYQQETSADDFIDFNIRFNTNKGWSEWVNIRPDHDHSEDHDDHDEELEEYLINTNRATGYQYKVNVEAGPDNVDPLLKIKRLTFIDAKAGKNNSLVAGFSIDDDPNIISRSQWGADESLGYGESISNVAGSDDPDIDSVKYSINGKDLKWPRQYAEDIDMLVVHHTASTSDLDDPKQAIRNIYYYHTVRRGWGDIGYNYIVDTDGRVYEGRAGGEMVIGGHAVAVNKVSVGVAVLGNYQTQEVPKDVIQGLADILTNQADEHRLDVLDDVTYKGKSYPVLGGHRDNGATACPGENLYRALPIIRHLVSGAEVYDNVSKLSRENYAYVDTDPLRDIVDLELGEDETVKIRLKNVGKKAWKSSSTYLTLSNDDDVKHSVVFDSTSKVARLLDSNVNPGETATFNVDMKGGVRGGFNGVQLVGVINGTSQWDLPIFIPVYNESELTYSVVGQDEFNLRLDPGERKDITVKLKNTSDLTWNDDYDVELGVSGGGRSSLVADLDVIDGKVKRGATETIKLKITAPKKSGVYSESLIPNIDGLTWFEGDPINLKVTVSGGSSSSSPSSSTSTSTTTAKRVESNVPLVLRGSVTVAQGVKKRYSFDLVNKTDKTWKKSSFTITKLGNKDVLITGVNMAQSTVRPGEVATISVDIRPSKKGVFNYQLRFYNGKELVYKTPFRLTIGTPGNSIPKVTSARSQATSSTSTKVVQTVAPTAKAQSPTLAKSTSNSLGPDIRIHLSVFDLSQTDVEAHGATDVYVDGKKIGSMNSRTSSYVIQSGNSVKVKMGSTTKTGRVIKYVPTSLNGTMTIADLDNRPAWNPSINDNRYRGAIEFRVEDGDLIAINELPMEHYIWGVAESSNSAHEETIKTIYTAARSYAYSYVTGTAKKFPGKPYDLDDSPARSQKYLGYVFEQRAPRVKSAVQDIAGKVVIYDGDPIKVPYFSRSDGRTKSAKEVWNWDTPYLVSVDDPYCEGQTPAGHGVGISGCGANGMANDGYNHEEIIQYFLKGVDFKNAY